MKQLPKSIAEKQQPNESTGERDLVKTFFEDQAESYALHFDQNAQSGAAALFQLRSRLATEMSSGDMRRSLLDVATGTGEISYAIASSRGFEEIHLNDLSPAMLKSCQRTFNQPSPPGEITWSNEDVFDLLPRLGASRFDIILCLGVLAHTGRLSELLMKMFDCLKPGGALILQSSITDHPGAWITALYARSALRRTRYKVSAYSKKDILTAANGAGFEIEEVRRFGVCLPFGDRILRKINHWLEAKYAEKLTERGGDALFKLRKPR